jgi:hypothetical protein
MEDGGMVKTKVAGDWGQLVLLGKSSQFVLLIPISQPVL